MNGTSVHPVFLKVSETLLGVRVRIARLISLPSPVLLVGQPKRLPLGIVLLAVLYSLYFVVD